MILYSLLLHGLLLASYPHQKMSSTSCRKTRRIGSKRDQVEYDYPISSVNYIPREGCNEQMDRQNVVKNLDETSSTDGKEM